MKKAPGEYLEVDVADQDGAIVIAPRGDAGHRQAERLGEALAQVAARHPQKVVLNLSGLTFLSSVAIGMFITFYRALSRQGAQLQVTGVPALIAEAIYVTGLDRWFNLPDRPADPAVMNENRPADTGEIC